MRALIRETWLPTLLIALPILALDLLRGGEPWPPRGTLTLYALVVVPPLWWRFVTLGPATVGRSVTGGVLCIAVLGLIPTLCLMLGAKPPVHDGARAAISAPLTLVLLSVATAFFLPYGAGVGVLVRRLRKHRPEGSIRA